jgi:hypothetical protein
MRPPFTSTVRLSDYLEFPRQIVSGPLMHATLVVNNPGGNINLTETCNPTLLVTLVKALPKGRSQSRWSASAASTSFITG